MNAGLNWPKLDSAPPSPLPRPERVQCRGFRCLAYRDADGSWKDFLTNRPLERVIGIVRYNLTDLLPS